MTQEQVAAPDYSPGYLSTVEAGRRTPSQPALSHFARRLGVTLDELTSGVPSSWHPEAALALQAAWQLLHKGEYGGARKTFHRVARESKRYGHASLEARAAVGLGRCAERQGQTTEARKLFERALELLEKGSALPECIEAVAGLARCHQMSGEPREALYVLETFVLRLEEQNLLDPAALMRAYASMIWPCMELGLNAKAREVSARALALQRRVDDPEAVAGMHVNVARSLLAQGHVQQALDSLRTAEDLYLEMTWSTEVARARMNRGMVLSAQGDTTRAMEELCAAVEAFKEVGFTRAEARALNELSRLERLRGNRDEAVRLARQALELLTDMEAAPEQALAHRELALSLKDSETTDSAAHFRRAIELYKRCDQYVLAADTHRLLGDLLMEMGSEAATVEYRQGLQALGNLIDRTD